MKCAILQSVDNNYNEIISITSPVNKKYAEYYGAEYILHKQAHDHERHPSWNKIYSTLDLMRSSRYDYIFFLDGDAVVIDFSRDIFDLARDNTDILLHLCSDGWRKRELDSNWGVFLIKSNMLMIQFLEKILYSPAYKGDSKNYTEDYFHTSRDWEQSVIQYEFNQAVSFYKKIVKIYPSDTFNHYYGNWVYHPCGPLNDLWIGPTDKEKAKLLKKKISQTKQAGNMYRLVTLDQKIYDRHDL